MTEWQENYDMAIDAMKTDYENTLKQCKMIFSCEVEVLTAIINKQ